MLVTAISVLATLITPPITNSTAMMAKITRIAGEMKAEMNPMAKPIAGPYAAIGCIPVWNSTRSPGIRFCSTYPTMPPNSPVDTDPTEHATAPFGWTAVGPGAEDDPRLEAEGRRIACAATAGVSS